MAVSIRRERRLTSDSCDCVYLRGLVMCMCGKCQYDRRQSEKIEMLTKQNEQLRMQLAEQDADNERLQELADFWNSSA